MNMTEQTVSGVNSVVVYDSLNSSLMELRIKRNIDTVSPQTNDLMVHVEFENSTNPTPEGRTYLFELMEPLNYLNGVSDEFIMRANLTLNNAKMEVFVKRLIGEDEHGVKYLLTDPLYEELEFSQVVFKEGINSLFTNYADADITIIYPKNTEFNKKYLNIATYAKDKENAVEIAVDDIYYSDCFTKTGNDINLAVDNAEIKSLSSKNNTFSLDSEGNLAVRTLTVGDATTPMDLLSVYPVGSIYMSVNNVDPSTLFGGIWEAITDKFLLSSGNTYTNGTTGGSATHTLTVAEMPSHNHSVSGNTVSNGGHSHNVGADLDCLYTTSGTKCYSMHGAGTSGAGKLISTSSVGGHTHSINLTSGSKGSGSAHNNMPPYLVVNVWKRIQ